MGLHPAIAAVRSAVRHALSGSPRGGLVLAACSGGADSLALAAALAFVAPRLGMRGGVLTVDHGLQDSSADRAEDVVRLARSMGLHPAEAVRVQVGDQGGPEAAARDARYSALASGAERHGAQAVLLGHTRDDQAETVLLGLGRGSGSRSLSGMPARTGIYLRPFIDLDRGTTRRACDAMGLPAWDDPHNSDRAFARVRVRHSALPILEKELGPGIAAALARTAALCRDDADALDQWADREYALLTGEGGEGLPVADLERLPAAIRRRILKRAAIAAGARPGSLGAVHMQAIDRLITEWRGQRRLDLPGGVGAVRRCGRLLIGKSDS